MTTGRGGPGSTQSLDALIQRSVDDGAAPHIYAAVARHGDVVYEGQAGDTARDRIYRIASMTKPVTSVACMQLVEQKLVSLDAPVTDYLDIAQPEVLEGVAADGTPTTRPALRAPTIRELLTHTAGYGYGIWHEQLHQLFTARGLGSLGPAGTDRLETPMVADPGTEWHYSVATDFIGRVVEEVAGTDLDSYMKRAIFHPLGMPDTSFTLADGQDSRLVGVHLRRLNGELRELELPRPEAGDFCSGGGGLASTPADYLRFLQAFLKGGELDGRRILETSTLRSMADNHTGDLTIPPMRSFDPPSSADVDLIPDTRTHWGLGFLVNADTVPGKRHAGSQTWAGLYNTHFWIDGSAGLAGLLLTQLLPFCDPAFMSLYDAFERTVYGTFGPSGGIRTPA